MLCQFCLAWKRSLYLYLRYKYMNYHSGNFILCPPNITAKKSILSINKLSLYFDIRDLETTWDNHDNGTWSNISCCKQENLIPLKCSWHSPIYLSNNLPFVDHHPNVGQCRSDPASSLLVELIKFLWTEGMVFRTCVILDPPSALNLGKYKCRQGFFH